MAPLLHRGLSLLSSIRPTRPRPGIIQRSRALREHAAANITTAVDFADEQPAGGAADGKAGGGGAAAAGKQDAAAGKGGKTGGGGDGKAAAAGEEDDTEDDGVGAYGKAFKDIAAEETEQEVQEFEVREDKVRAGFERALKTPWRM